MGMVPLVRPRRGVPLTLPGETLSLSSSCTCMYDKSNESSYLLPVTVSPATVPQRPGKLHMA